MSLDTIYQTKRRSGAGTLTATAADARYDLKTSRKTFDVVADYGAVGDGSVDDTVAIQTAFYAAVTYANAANKTAVINFPGSGVYNLNHATATCINWDGSNVGRIILRGNGSTIKCGRNSRIFIHYSGANPALDIGNLTIQDFIFDNNNTTKTWGQNGLILNLDCSPTFLNTCKNILIKDCEVRNMPRQVLVGDPFQICVNIELYCTNNTERDKSVIFDSITVQDCNFGKIGYGGSYGVRMQSLLTTGAAGATDQTRNRSWFSAHQFNNVRLQRIYHDGGPHSSTYYANSNFMLGSGGHGISLVCEDLVCLNSGDDGLEINSFLNVTVNRCRFHNSQTAAGILLTNLGGMPDPNLQRIVITNCRFERQSGPGGSNLFWRHHLGAPNGHLIVENCQFVDSSIEIRATFASLSLRNLQYIRTEPWTNGGFTDIAPFNIEQHGGRATVSIENLIACFDTTYNNPNSVSNSYLYMTAIRMSFIADINLSIKNVTLRNNVTGLSGIAGSPRIGAVIIAPGGNEGVVDFGGTNNGAFWFDNGSSASVKITGGKLAPGDTADYSQEIRAIASQGNSDYWNYAIGPDTDKCVEANYNVPTAITGFKGGIIGKSITATTYIDAYLYDDGTNSYVCLDRVVGGTRSSFLGTIVGGAGTVTAIASPPAHVSDRGIQLTSRFTAGQSVWIRYRQLGLAIEADYGTGAMATFTGTVTTAAAVTMSANSDIQKFYDTLGYSGYSWVPVDNTSRMDTFTYYRCAVIRGTIDTILYEHLSGTNLDWLYILTLTFAGGRTRWPDLLRIRNLGIGRYKGIIPSANIVDVVAGQERNILRDNIRNADGNWFTTVTAPGSTVAYTSIGGALEQVFWYGGTLTTPFVEVSSNAGGTWNQIKNTNTEGVVTLMPGDQIRWTYSAAPTIKRCPVG